MSQKSNRLVAAASLVIAWILVGVESFSVHRRVIWPRNHLPAISSDFRRVARSKSVVTAFASPFEDDEDTTNYDEEETLLQIHLSVLPDVEIDEALDRVSRYCQAFPFAVILPVQPLQYLPTPDGGVNVKFLRKKTKEKGSLDGGIRFFIRKDRDGIEVIVKRNSEGQAVSKMFSEKLVVQGFVKGISGETPEQTNKDPTDVVAVESVFHKWLDL